MNSSLSDRRTSHASVLISDAKVLLFSFAAKLNRRVTVSFENNQMLKTVKYSFVGRKSIFFLFLNYVFSYCKHCYVPIYQNYILLIIPFLSHLSLILLSICNLL